MKETEIKDNVRRRSRFKKIMIGAGVMLFGLMMVGRMATAARFHRMQNFRAQQTVAQSAPETGSEGEGASSSSSERQENYEGRESRHSHHDHHGRHGHGRHGFSIFSRLIGVGLLVGGLALFWRNRNPDYGYSSESVEKHMKQEFDEDDIKIDPDADSA